MAGLASARRDDRTSALSTALHGRRRRQPARRARALSRQDALPHPRHQSALNHRHVRVVWVHPPHQRGHHRSLFPGAGRHARGRAAGTAAGLGERGTADRSDAAGAVQSAGAAAHSIAPFTFDLSLPGLDPGNAVFARPCHTPIKVRAHCYDRFEEARGAHCRRGSTREDVMHDQRGLTRRHVLAGAAGGLALTFGPSAGWAQAAKKIEQLDPALDKIIDKAQPIQELATGYGGDLGPAEGPVWWKEGGYLLFND